MNKPILGAIACALSSTLIGAQTVVDAVELVDANTIDWPQSPAYGAGGSFLEAITGDFSDDFLEHSIVVRDQIPVFLHAPNSYAALGLLPSVPSVTGIATLELDSAPDQVVYADAAGFWRRDFDPTVLDLVNPLLLSAAWSEVKRITVVDLDAAFGDDFLAIAPHGDEVWQLMSQASGYAAGAVIMAAGKIADYTVADYDQDGALEIIVLSPTRLEAFELTGGSPSKWWPILDPAAGVVTAIPNAHDVGDRVVLATPYPSSTNYFLTALEKAVRDPVIQLQFPATSGGPLDWIVPASIAPVRLTPFRDDVMLTHQTHGTAIGLHNVSDPAVPGSVHFDGSFLSRDLTGTPALATPTDLARPAYTDFNGFGVDGGVFPLDSKDGVRVIEQLGVIDFNAGDSIAVSVVNYHEIDSSSGQLVLYTQLDGARIAEGFDHLQIIRWFQPDDGAGVQIDTMFNEVFSFTPDGSNDVQRYFTVDVPQPTYFPKNGGQPHYYLQARLVKATGGVLHGDTVTVVDADRTFLFGMTNRADPVETEYDDYLFGLPAATAMLDTWANPNGAGLNDPQEAGAVVGAFIRASRVPDFTGGGLPDIGAPTLNTGSGSSWQ